MAVYDLEEQEQIENLKAWWQKYGNRLTLLLCAIAIASISWQSWRWYQNKQSGEAGVLYANLGQAIAQDEADQVRRLGGELSKRYGSTDFAPIGIMLSAKYYVLKGDLETAKVQLLWVAEHDGHELADLARLRLAGILLDEKDYAGALRELAHKPAAAFAAAYAELEGDIGVEQGEPEKAKAAYQKALELRKADLREAGAQDENAVEIAFPILRQKLDALGGA
ncbi:MAG: tetratricopeptide repeat protein [Zoogloeaceae bacterium]|jgi:predicted negative regulator of RcsB-dependent stress response|nr:tetratricopeptide repeat protein [Zoogloeaceae bacterium]